MEERREIKRITMQRPAKILIQDFQPENCIAVDLNSRGVGVETTHTRSLPGEFVLTFDAGRTLRRCRLVWRVFNRLGAEFTDSAQVLTPERNTIAGAVIALAILVLIALADAPIGTAWVGF
jgi:hypothetical protein